MNDTSTWPTLVFLALAIAMLSAPRIFRFIDTAPAAHQHRLDALDGLRGILASAVFFHHYFLSTYSGKLGIPDPPPVPYYNFLGPAAVSGFFMITGYLFWSKILSRKGIMAWWQFFANRLFRIYPLYLVLILYYFMYACYHRDQTPAQDPAETVSQALQWLAFGAVGGPTPFLGQPGFMGLVGQTWTLSYEWMFYLSLPVLAGLARMGSCAAAVLGALVLAYLHPAFLAWPANALAADLLIGMAVAHLLAARPRTDLRSPLLSIIAVFTLVVAIARFSQPYQFETTALCGIVFLIVSCGNTMFGLLTTAGAKRLGNVSYSIYLLHGVVINLLSTIPRYHTNMYSHGLRYWATFAATYAIVVLASVASYRLVELNGVALGRRFADWLERKHRGGATALTVGIS